MTGMDGSVRLYRSVEEESGARVQSFGTGEALPCGKGSVNQRDCASCRRRCKASLADTENNENM